MQKSSCVLCFCLLASEMLWYGNRSPQLRFPMLYQCHKQQLLPAQCQDTHMRRSSIYLHFPCSASYSPPGPCLSTWASLSPSMFPNWPPIASVYWSHESGSWCALPLILLCRPWAVVLQGCTVLPMGKMGAGMATPLAGHTSDSTSAGLWLRVSTAVCW